MSDLLRMPVARAVRQRVVEALADVARREGVRVLLAVESGSRAWGFPSRDSDYDIRFIYLRPVADYLAVFPPRDVIECPIEDDIDMGGWDLRKALALLVRSNAVLLEWLSSPIVYRSETGPVVEIAQLAETHANQAALEYHYDRLARKHWPDDSGELCVKSLCYALRPAFALKWLRDFRRPPPMDLPTLTAGLDLARDLRAAVDRLRESKACGREADLVSPDPSVRVFLQAVLAVGAARPVTWDRAPATAAADRLFRRLLEGSVERLAAS